MSWKKYVVLSFVIKVYTTFLLELLTTGDVSCALHLRTGTFIFSVMETDNTGIGELCRE